VKRLRHVARHDWKHSHRLDLSDGGLIADLEGHIEDGAEMLGIDVRDREIRQV
jgi:cardiolipin synthase